MWKTPKGEKQRIIFDTNACGIFSVLNAIESWLIKFGEPINISDQFVSAMVGGVNGNLPKNVIKGINKYGFIEEKDFPFKASSRAEYYSKQNITTEMKKKAKKILNKYTFSYEYLNFGRDGKTKSVKEALKVAPLVAVILNKNGTSHSIMIPNERYYFDSYIPYTKRLDINRLHYAIKVTVKKKNSVWSYFKPTEWTNSKKTHTIAELKPSFVDLLDKIRGECGFPFKITSGYRTKKENKKVKGVSGSAHCDRIAVDIYCKDSKKRQKIIDVARRNGINRIGVASNFIHLDIAKNKPQYVTWTY